MLSLGMEKLKPVILQTQFPNVLTPEYKYSFGLIDILIVGYSGYVKVHSVGQYGTIDSKNGRYANFIAFH